MITYDACANDVKGGPFNTPLEEDWVIDQGQIWYVWPI